MSSVTIRSLRLGGSWNTSPSTSVSLISGISSSRRNSSFIGGRMRLDDLGMGSSAPYQVLLPGFRGGRLDLDDVAVLEHFVVMRHAARVLPHIAGLGHEDLIADMHAQLALLQADDRRMILVHVPGYDRALLEIHFQHVHAVGHHQQLDGNLRLVELRTLGAADANL